MARSGAKLFAAVVAAGTALPVAAQTPDQAVSVDVPRAPTQGPQSPFSVLPDAAQSAGFHVSTAVVASTSDPQPMPPGTAAPNGASASLAAPTTGAPGAPVTNGPWQPSMPTGPQYPMYPPPQRPVAPAWRWHGYGAVVPIETIQSIPPTAAAAPAPKSPAEGSAVPSAPTALEVNPGGNWRPSGVVTTDSAPQPLPPITPVPTLSAADPAWRSGVQPAAYRSSNTMTVAAPAMVVPAAETRQERREPAVTLDAPRAAGTYISRGVSDAIVLPASYSSPAPPPKPQPATGMQAVRTSVERACAGRARDVELVNRGPSSLLVRLKVRQQSDAEYLANTIARLPELGPYQVLFEMQVAR